MFRCKNCEGTKFLFTEITTTTIHLEIDTATDEDPVIEKTDLITQYKLKCLKCGAQYEVTEKDEVDWERLGGVIYDINEALEEFERKYR